MKILETIKAHPYATAGVVFAIGLVVLLSSSGGNSQAISANNSAALDAQASEVQAASQYQQAALGAQTQLASDQINANTASQNIAANVTIAQGNNQTSVNNNYITTQGAISIAGIQADVAKLTSTLSAQVAEASYTAQTDAAQIASNTAIALGEQNVQNLSTVVGGQTQQTQINANQNVSIAQINSNTLINESNNERDIALANTGSNFFGGLVTTLFF